MAYTVMTDPLEPCVLCLYYMDHVILPHRAHYMV